MVSYPAFPRVSSAECPYLPGDVHNAQVAAFVDGDDCDRQCCRLQLGRVDLRRQHSGSECMAAVQLFWRPASCTCLCLSCAGVLRSVRYAVRLALCFTVSFAVWFALRLRFCWSDVCSDCCTDGRYDGCADDDGHDCAKPANPGTALLPVVVGSTSS